MQIKNMLCDCLNTNIILINNSSLFYLYLVLNVSFIVFVIKQLYVFSIKTLMFCILKFYDKI